jgi:hypothetical protein
MFNYVAWLIMIMINFKIDINCWIIMIKFLIDLLRAVPSAFGSAIQSFYLAVLLYFELFQVLLLYQIAFDFFLASIIGT